MSSDHPRTIRNGVQNGDAPVEYPQTQSPDEPYRISPQYHSRRSKIRVASVGAGASGLCLAYKMEKMLQAGTWELTLFEKNDHLGGTWYENRCEAHFPRLVFGEHIRRLINFVDIPAWPVTFRRIFTRTHSTQTQTGLTSSHTAPRSKSTLKGLLNDTTRTGT